MAEMAGDGPVPQEFLCPITLEIMIDPVIASDEHTYERMALLLWMQKHHTSPVTRQPLKSDFRRNLALRQLISSWEERHRSADLVQGSAALSRSPDNDQGHYSDAGLEARPCQDNGRQCPLQKLAKPGGPTVDPATSPSTIRPDGSQLGGNQAGSLPHATLQPQQGRPPGVEELPVLVSRLQDWSNPHSRELAAAALQVMTRAAGPRPAVANAALPALAALLQDPACPQGRRHAAGVILHLTYDATLRRQVAAAALPALAQALQDPATPQARINAAAAVSNLAQDATLCGAVADAALPALAQALQCPATPQGRINAAAALANLAQDAALRGAVADAALPALAQALQDPATPQGKINAAIALRRLANEPCLRKAVAHAALPALVGLLQDSAAPGSQTQAAGCLAELAAETHLQPQLARSALPGLSGLLQAPASPECTAHAARVLAHLACHCAAQHHFPDAALPALISLLGTQNSSDDFCNPARFCAVLAISSLATFPKHRPVIAQAALPALVDLMKASPSPYSKAVAACALYNLADAPNLQQSVSDAALSVLIRTLQDSESPEARAQAARVLGRLAVTSSEHIRCQLRFAAGDALDGAARDASSTLSSKAAKRAFHRLHASRAKVLRLQLGYKCRRGALSACCKAVVWLDIHAYNLEQRLRD